MLHHHHPPSEEIRQTITDFRVDNRPSPSQHQSCACCRVEKPNNNHKELKFLALIVFAVTAVLIGLNAYQRDRIENDMADANLGPGASQAAELSFPSKTPTDNSTMYAPQATPQSQYAMVPLASVRPSEPVVLQYMAVPLNDGKGTIRLKRVVGR